MECCKKKVDHVIACLLTDVFPAFMADILVSWVMKLGIHVSRIDSYPVTTYSWPWKHNVWFCLSFCYQMIIQGESLVLQDGIHNSIEK